MPVESRRRIRAFWGHCDPAGIVYYPNYFDWFDQCYQALLGSVGWRQNELRRRWGMVGTGVVDVSGRFRSPVSNGDTLDALTYVERWSARSFTVYHRLEKEGTLTAEGREVRLWLLPHRAEAGRIEAGVIPEEFKRRLGWQEDSSG